MKKLLCLALFSTVVGCSLFTAQNAKNVLDVAKTACIIANATLGNATVQQVCNIAEEEIPIMNELLDSQRAAVAKAKFDGCGADAGARR